MDDAALTIRLCALLGGLPGWQWSTDGPYAPDRVGVFYGAIPADMDLAVGVRVYGVNDAGDIRQRRVQLRSRGGRGDPRGADDLAAVSSTVLTGAGRLPGISGIRHLSMAPLGADGSDRQERSDNFIVTLDNLEALS